MITVEFTCAALANLYGEGIWNKLRDSGIPVGGDGIVRHWYETNRSVWVYQWIPREEYERDA